MHVWYSKISFPVKAMEENRYRNIFYSFNIASSPRRLKSIRCISVADTKSKKIFTSMQSYGGYSVAQVGRCIEMIVLISFLHVEEKPLRISRGQPFIWYLSNRHYDKELSSIYGTYVFSFLLTFRSQFFHNFQYHLSAVYNMCLIKFMINSRSFFF